MNLDVKSYFLEGEPREGITITYRTSVEEENFIY